MHDALVMTISLQSSSESNLIFPITPYTGYMSVPSSTVSSSAGGEGRQRLESCKVEFKINICFMFCTFVNMDIRYV